MKVSGLGLIALLIVSALMPALGFRAPSSRVAAFQREPAQNTAPPIDEPVTFDVVITDAKARPVRDLQPGDVELSDAGEMHAVDTVRLHEGGGRMIGILLDEFHVRAGSSTLRARAALMHLVDAMLRADDLVALVKPLDPLHAITFTQDRALMRQIIGTFEGHAGDYTPRTDFERNFMSRDPRTAEATRAQVVSAALQSLARRLGEQQGRKALLFVSEGFRPPQPRAIVFAANRSRVSLYALDPDPEAADGESMLRSIAEQTGGVASINDADLNPVIAQAIADLDRYFVLTFRPLGPADGRFRPVEVRVKRPGVLARARSGYWAPDAKVAALAAKIAAERSVVPFKVSRSSPYIRPWIGMTRGSDGLTNVTVTWEPGSAPPRNQRVASVMVRAIAKDGSVVFENRVGAGDMDRAMFSIRPGPVALEMELQSSSGAALDTDYRAISVPNLRVTRPTFGTPQVLRTRNARDFAAASQNTDAVPVASRTFSRTERLLIRVPAYGAGESFPVVTARLLNRRGVAMRTLQAIDAPLPPGTVQFDLPLAAFAPDEYRIELSATNATGPAEEARETIPIRVTN